MGRVGCHRTPILFIEHGRDFPDYPRPKRKLANRFLLNRRDRVVAVGECVRRALNDNEGLPSQRIDVTYNGIELARYDPSRPQRERLRQQFHFASEDVVIIQVARLNRLKDHPTVVRAMAQLLQSCPTARLVLVGDGEERAAIEALVQTLNLTGHVRFLGVRNDVLDLLQMADLFLLSSISEGIPLTMIEAMATGLPCVATAVGGNPELIVEGVTGTLAQANEPADLAGKLKKLCCDEDLREHWGHAGFNRALEHFHSQQMHDSFEQLYVGMLGSNRGGAKGDSTNMEREAAT